MKKNIFLLLPCLIIFLTGIMSCAEDTEVTDPYANWQARNEHYLDSIVSIARTNADGNWEIYRNYKINNDNTSAGGIITNNPYETPASETDSVYMRIIEPADPDGIAPLYTDSVYVYYRGWTVDGNVFDENYQGELNTAISSPTVFSLPGLESGVEGWITTLMHMKEGERVEVTIPADLAYESQSQDNIPAWSVLIFDIKLEKVVHPDGPDSRSIPEDKEQQENEQ